MKYAAYGSNLHPVRLRERVPSAQLLACVVVAGWQLRFHKRSNHDGSGKCNIVGADDSVHFAIFEITADEKRLLDQAEGLHFGYVDTAIEISGQGECFAYVASETHVAESLAPYGWYKELVLAGAEYHRFPEAYIARIRDVVHRDDPDPDRHALNMAIVERARTHRLV